MNLKSWHFFIPLQTAIEVPHGLLHCDTASEAGLSPFGESPTEGRDVRIIFWQESVVEPYSSTMDAVNKTLAHRMANPPSALDASFTADIYRTVCEVIVSKEFGKRIATDSDGMSESFRYGLKRLNNWLRAFSVVSLKPVEPVTVEKLPAFLPVGEGAFEPKDYPANGIPKISLSSLSINNLNLPVANGLPEIADGLMRNIDAAIMHVENGAPFTTYWRLYCDGLRYLQEEGDYAVSIILFASAAEALFDELLQHLLWEQEYKPEAAMLEFGQSGVLPKPGKRQRPMGVYSLVKNRLLPRIGAHDGSLEFPEQLNRWSEDLAYVRNRIVHNAYRPTFSEARKAKKSLEGAAEYILDSAFKVRDDYPLTALALLGRAGLAERGVEDSAIPDFETTHSELWQRLTAFRLWSNYLTSLRFSDNLLGEVVDPSECRLVAVCGDNDDVAAYLIHQRVPVVSPIEHVGVEVSRQMFLDPNANRWGNLSTVDIEWGLAKLNIPAGLTWQAYSYDCLPQPNFMARTFSDRYRSESDRKFPS